MKNQTFQQMMKHVHELIAKDQWQTALEELRLADVKFPQTPAILTAMGDCQIHLEKPEAAISQFLKVVELEPGSVEAYNNLGVAYMFAQDFPNAEATYLEALQFKPNHSQTLKNLAFLYYQQEARLGDAATLLASVIRENPSDCEALFLMGQCYEVGEDLPSAKLCYERILVYQPGSQLALEALNQVHFKKN
ncbi:MAG TPA: tetratricopeptide repeat protein [Leptolinea sp.]